MSRLQAAIARAKTPTVNDAALDAVRDAWLAELVDDGIFKLDDFNAQGALVDPSKFSLTICKAIDAEAHLGDKTLCERVPLRGALAIFKVKAEGQSGPQQRVLAAVASALDQPHEPASHASTLLATHDADGVNVILHADTAHALLARLNAGLSEPIKELPAAAVQR